MRCVETGRASPLRSAAILVLSLMLACVFPSRACPWGGEHHRISRAAIQCLPREEQEYLRPEQSAIVKTYCTFPDVNWPCYGPVG